MFKRSSVTVSRSVREMISRKDFEVYRGIVEAMRFINAVFMFGVSPQQVDYKQHCLRGQIIHCFDGVHKDSKELKSFLDKAFRVSSEIESTAGVLIHVSIKFFEREQKRHFATINVSFCFDDGRVCDY